MTARFSQRLFPAVLTATLLGYALLGLSGCARQKFAAAHYLCRTEKYRTLSAANSDSLSAEDFAFLVRHKKQCYDYQIQVAEMKRNPPKQDDSALYFMTVFTILLSGAIVFWALNTGPSNSN